ncbi:MAG: uracil-xanthine permease family protein [Clostridia bacterium]
MEKNQTKVKSCLKNSVLAFQHMFAMLGATITVPLLTGMNTSLALIASGIGTLVFFFVTKRKVPVYLGSSFAFLAVLQSFFADGYTNEMMGKVVVGIIATGLVYVVFSVIIKFFGSGFIKKLFPPVVIGSVIVCIGLGLAPGGAIGPIGQSWQNWVIAIATLVTIICVSSFGRGYFKMLPILMGFIVGYAVALCFGVVDFTTLSSASWIIFEPKTFEEAFGFYKYLAIDWEVIISIAPLAIVTFMEHIGDINANGAVCGMDFIKDPGLHRTVLGDGLATICAGLVGGPPNTTYGENTGVIALTGNKNPNNLALAACFAIFLGIFSKFGGLIETIPGPVIGGASFILYGMISGQGLKSFVDGKVDFTHNRNLIIAGVVMVIGLGFNFANVNVHIGNLPISALALATFVGIVLNLILPKGANESFGDVSLAITGIGLEKEDFKKEKTEENTEEKK